VLWVVPVAVMLSCSWNFMGVEECQCHSLLLSRDGIGQQQGHRATGPSQLPWWTWVHDPSRVALWQGAACLCS
jgi:hypothetical protein